MKDRLKERCVTDDQGTRTGVLLDEELETLRVCDAARSSGDESVPFEQAVAEVEKNRH